MCLKDQLSLLLCLKAAYLTTKNMSDSDSASLTAGNYYIIK